VAKVAGVKRSFLRTYVESKIDERTKAIDYPFDGIEDEAGLKAKCASDPTLLLQFRAAVAFVFHEGYYGRPDTPKTPKTEPLLDF
jgi:hypothetical protein